MSDTHDFILEAPDDKMCVENIQLVSDTNHFNSKALTDKINDCEMFMKGIDYSYYYEQEE